MSELKVKHEMRDISPRKIYISLVCNGLKAALRSNQVVCQNATCVMKQHDDGPQHPKLRWFQLPWPSQLSLILTLAAEKKYNKIVK